MAFGVYIHIPYCLQICPYCDFAKYRLGKIMAPANYIELLKREIQIRACDVPIREIDTIYFGGGTPSLFEPELILTVLDELANAGFTYTRNVPKTSGLGSAKSVEMTPIEITIEIDPATIDQSRLEKYLEIGINRFSVGAQTFSPRLLKIAGRKHTSDDTIELLTLLQQHRVNYSFDLLFGLPTQTLAELRADILAALQFNPSQLSAYLLTVPDSHPMAKNRAPDEEQVEMFNLIESELEAAGVLRYEISNFAKPGLESRHNMLYWTDQAYWGLGVSAHSYFPRSLFREPKHWGQRFWNSSSISGYEKELKEPRDGSKKLWQFVSDLPQKQCEQLTENQSLSEFCHTSLRLSRGLSICALRLKFGESRVDLVRHALNKLEADGYLSQKDDEFFLTAHGRILANHVFAELTYLPESLPK